MKLSEEVKKLLGLKQTKRPVSAPLLTQTQTTVNKCLTLGTATDKELN